MESKIITIGCRIPKNFFETKGKGSSDITKHAGSMHLALKEAGIEMGNIMTYSSILPKIANKIDKPEEIIHGSVIESIMAMCHGEKNQVCTAGIIYGWIYDKKTGEKFGGLVCEHADNVSEEEIINRLYLSLDELYYNGFSDRFEMREKHHITQTYIGDKIHNTALVSLCFMDYEVPIL